MQLHVINDIFSGKIVQALCWMLVHSLWLGLALTVVTGSIILSTKKQTAALRYYLLTGALLLFTIAVVTVFIMQLTAGEFVYSATGISTITNIAVGNNSDANAIYGTNSGFTSSLISFFNEHAALVVWCWFLIIAFRCVQFAGGLYKIKQIKTTQLTPVSEYWKQRLAHLAAVLNIKSNIQLVQSGLAKMPMVAGHFKPVILFPLGLLTALPAAEVEAVLLHELAHIRRKDYLVSLLQHFTEIIFFFNPAVLWVSSLIKTERENCCDDIAVAQAGNKRNYINALVSFQEYHLHTMQYATALSSDKNQLLQRVKRMLYNNNKTLNNMEKTFLAVCFVATTSLVIFFTTATTAQTNGTVITKSGTDTTISIADKHYNPADFEEGSNTSYSEKINGVTHTLVIYKRNGTLYEIYGDITSFKIDGKAIPQSDWGKYKKLINELRADHKKELAVSYDTNEKNEKLNAEKLVLLAALDKINAEREALQNQDTSKVKAEQLALLAQQDMLKNKLQYLQSMDKLKAEQEELQGQQGKLNADQQKLLLDQEKMRAEQYNKDALNKKLQALKLEAEKKHLETDKQKQKAELRQQLADIEKEKAEKNEAEKEKQAAKDEKQVAKDEKQAAKDEEQAAKDEKKDTKEDKQIIKEKKQEVKKDKRVKREERQDRKEETGTENKKEN